MRRWTVIALVGLSGLAVVLAASLAYVGTQLDDAKISRQDLEFEVEDLRQELNVITDDQRGLVDRYEEQRRTNELLVQELERARAAAQAIATASAPTTDTPSIQAQ